MANYKVKKFNSDICEISIPKYKDSYIRVQLIQEHLYCAISTFVSPEDRGEGIGGALYDTLLKFIRDHKAHFAATCPFIVQKADEDKSVKDIYEDLL